MVIVRHGGLEAVVVEPTLTDRRVQAVPEKWALADHLLSRMTPNSVKRQINNINAVVAYARREYEAPRNDVFLTLDAAKAALTDRACRLHLAVGMTFAASWRSGDTMTITSGRTLRLGTKHRQKRIVRLLELAIKNVKSKRWF